MNKSILEVVHDNAKDLYVAGLMDEVTLRKFDTLCLPPLTEYDDDQIMRIQNAAELFSVSGDFFVSLHRMPQSPSFLQKWFNQNSAPVFNGPSPECQCGI